MNLFLGGILLYIDASIKEKEGDKLDGLEEKECVIRMQKGDKQAFSVIYNQYKERIFKTACLISGNQADGEDIMQETFVKILLHCEELKKPEAFKYWAFKILNRTAWSMRNKQKKEIPTEEFECQFMQKESKHLPFLSLIKKEKSDTIWKVIQRLPYKQKVVVVLYYYNELSVGQIADVMGCNVGTVKSRLYTARKKLEKVLSKEMTFEEVCYENE